MILKFRAYFTEDFDNYGQFLKKGSMFYSKDWPYSWGVRESKLRSLWRWPNFEVEKFPAEIDIFTGLHDINGKEIYENDIVETYFTADSSEPNIGLVSFFTGYFGIYESFLLSDYSEIRVIGNIHQNPELLEEK